jgi:hypothetical protein
VQRSVVTGQVELDLGLDLDLDLDLDLNLNSNNNTQAPEQITTVSYIYRAIAHQWLCLFYQPKVAIGYLYLQEYL